MAVAGEMRFVITVDNKGAVTSINKYGESTEKTTQKTEKLNKSLGSQIKSFALMAGSVMLAKKAFDFIGKSITLAVNQENAVAQLEATIKSTGGVAGLTSKELQNMATSLQGVTTFGDEAIIGAQSLILTFKNIGKDIFPDLTEAILDTSIAMKQDLRTSVIQIGKVMNDPIANLGALSRSGIQFSDSQKVMIRTMQESGNLMGAQKIILKELQSQFGGSARAASKTFGGAMQQASNIIGDAREQLANEFMPALISIANWITNNKDFITSGFKAIGSAIGFMVGPLKAISLSTELSKANKEIKKSLAEQASEFENTFNKIYVGLREAGVGFETLNSAISSMPGAERINELTEKEKDLTEWIKKGATSLDEYGLNIDHTKYATEELNKVSAERNYLLSQGIVQIVRNSASYGITADQVDILRKNLQELNKTHKKENIETVRSIKPLTDVEKIMKKYGVSTQSATAILQKQKPEIVEIAGLQKKLGISLEEATKTYRILNNLELERKRVLKDINITMPKVIENYTELDDAVKLISDKYSENIDKAEDEKRALEELNEVVEDGGRSFSELAEKQRELDEATMGLAISLSYESTELEELKKRVGYFSDIAIAAFKAVMDIAGDSSSKVALWGEVVGEAFEGFKSGGYIGAFISLVGNIDKLADALWSTTDTVGIFNNKLEQTKDILSDVAGVTDLAAMHMANFLIQVDNGAYSLEEFTKYLKDIKDIQNDVSGAWGLFSFPEFDASKMGDSPLDWLAKDVAGTDPGAISEAMMAAQTGLVSFLEGGAASQAEFSDQVNITMGVFANLMKSGQSITEVLYTMGDSFDALIASQEESGYVGSETFEALKQYRTLIKDNEDLVKSVEGFNQVLQMTGELGKIDQDQMESYGRSAVTQFDKLITAGFSSNQALQMMGPSLKVLSDNAEHYGTTLDANTQSLVDQAKEAGVFDEMADPLDTIADILTKIGEALGADMSEFENLAVTATAGAATTSKSFEDVNMEMVKVGENTTNTAKTMSGSMDAFAEMSADSMKSFAGESVDAMTMLAEGSVNAMTTLSDGTNNAANSMKSGFDDASKKSLDSIRNFVNAANKELGKLGQNNGFPQPPLNPPQRNIPKFATGGGGIVPPGFNNDNFLIGVSSGEEFKVTPAGGNINNSRTVGDVNMTVVVQASSGDSVDTLTNKLIQAVRVNGQNIVGELEKAGL